MTSLYHNLAREFEISHLFWLKFVGYYYLQHINSSVVGKEMFLNFKKGNKYCFNEPHLLNS
jgi:hypothetical protein